MDIVPLGQLRSSCSKLLIPMLIVQAYANSKGVKIVGDIPIYVGGQSADVWAYQALFELGKGSQPLMVSGVPPDAFSDTGQLWGSPLYDWKVSLLAALTYSFAVTALKTRRQ